MLVQLNVEYEVCGNSQVSMGNGSGRVGSGRVGYEDLSYPQSPIMVPAWFSTLFVADNGVFNVSTMLYKLTTTGPRVNLRGIQTEAANFPRTRFLCLSIHAKPGKYTSKHCYRSARENSAKKKLHCSGGHVGPHVDRPKLLNSDHLAD